MQPDNHPLSNNGSTSTGHNLPPKEFSRNLSLSAFYVFSSVDIQSVKAMLCWRMSRGMMLNVKTCLMLKIMMAKSNIAASN